jgi:hypothetical protein
MAGKAGDVDEQCGFRRLYTSRQSLSSVVHPMMTSYQIPK